MAAHPRLRRALKMASEVVLWITATILLLVLVGLILLGQGAGSGVVNKILGLVNAQISGRIEVERSFVFPNGTVVLRGVRLFDPEGVLVAEIGGLETTVTLPELLEEKLVIAAPRASGVRLLLTINEAGDLNLLRSFAPRHLGPLKPPSRNAKKGGGFAITIDDIHLAIDEASFGQAGQRGPLVRLRQGKLGGHFDLDRNANLSVSADLDPASVETPLDSLRGPLALHGRLTLVDGRLRSNVTLTVDDSAVDAEAEIDLGALDGHVEVSRVVAGPHVVAAVVPGLASKGAKLSASATLAHGVLRLERLLVTPLSSSPGSGNIQVTGALTLTTGDGRVSVGLHHLDTAAFLDGLPKSDVNLVIDASFETLFAHSRAALIHLTIDKSVYAGEFFGPGHFTLQRKGKRLALSDLSLSLPGASVAGGGQLDGRRIEAIAHLAAPDLDRLREAVETISGINLPDFAGDLSGDVRVSGTLGELGIAADLRSARVVLNGLVAEGLTAHIEAPQIGRQMDVHGKVELSRFQAGKLVLRDLDLTTDWTTPTLTVLAQGRESKQLLVVWTRLTLPPDLQSATVEELELSLPHGEWRLANPARADFRQGVAIRGLALSEGSQRLGGDLQVSPKGTRAAVDFEAVDLSQFPSGLTAGAILHGVVSGSAQFDEVGRALAAQGDVELRDLGIPGLELSEVHLIGKLEAGRVNATLSTKVGGGSIVGRFAGPVPFAAGPLNGAIELRGADLADFKKLVLALNPYGGQLDANFALGGTWWAPQATLTLNASQLTGPWLGAADELGSVSRAKATQPASKLVVPLLGKLNAGLQVVLGSDKLTADLTVGNDPLTIDPAHGVGPQNVLVLNASAALGGDQLGPLLRQPSQLRSRFETTAFKLELAAAPLSVRSLAAALPQLESLGGSLQFELTAEGTARAPRADATVDWRDLTVDGRRLGELTLAVGAHDQGLQAHLKLQPPPDKGGGAAVINGHWKVVPEQLRDAHVRATAPLRTDIAVSDLALATFLGKRSQLTGLIGATGQLRGTLGAPIGHVQVELSGLAVSQQPAGELSAAARWDGKLVHAELWGSQPAGGKLLGKAVLPVSLTGFGPGPIDGNLSASAFNLGLFAPPLVEKQVVRALAGTLDADFTVTGTRAALVPRGKIALSGGDLALNGLGEFQHIDIAAHLDAEALAIDKIHVSSGGGPLDGAFRAAKTSDGYALSGHLEARRFGVYVEDELRALFSSKIALHGSYGKAGADLTAALTQVRVRIPELLQRTLGPVALDPDIHLGPIQKKPPPPETNDDGTAVGASASRTLTLHVSAPGPIDVEGPDVTLNARADLYLRLAAAAQMRGELAVDDGQVNAFNQQFSIDHANITFGDGEGGFAPPQFAAIDAEADQEVDGFNVAVIVTGRLTHPIPSLTSDPPLPQSRIASLLISGGNGASTTGGNDQGTGFSLLGDLLSEQVKSVLGAASPFDVLTLEPNRAEAGKRITPKLYVGVIANTSIDPRVNGTEVHARYDLGHRFDLDGRYGTAQAGSLDLQWLHSW